MTVRIINAHVLDALAQLPDESVHCVVTSPPYFGLRSYQIEPQIWGGVPECSHEWGSLERGKRKDMLPADQTTSAGRSGSTDRQDGAAHNGGRFCVHCNAWRGELGLEPTPALYIEHLVAVFAEVRRVLRKDGTLWVVIGDSYANDGKWGGHTGGKHAAALHCSPIGRNKRYTGLKPKDLIGIPWRLAFALQDEGWWLRQDNVWNKPNPMPESTEDRTTRSHEFVFHLSKSAIYWYDGDAIKEAAAYSGPNAPDAIKSPYGQGFTRSARDNFKRKGSKRAEVFPGQSVGTHRPDRDDSAYDVLSRNKRSVWTVATVPSSVPHFATYPPALIEPCILAGCPVGGTVLDPFIGVGTTAIVAERLARNCIGIELSPKYAAIADRRARSPGFALEFAEVAAE